MSIILQVKENSGQRTSRVIFREASLVLGTKWMMRMMIASRNKTII